MDGGVGLRRRIRLISKLCMTSAIVGLLVGNLSGLASAQITPAVTSAVISSQITQTSGDISVIVQLGTQPAAVGKYAAKQGLNSLAQSATERNVQREQAEFLEEAADSGLSLQVNYQYDTVLNGFEVTLPADQLTELAKLPGVKAIDANRTWYPIPIESSLSEEEAFNYDSNPLKQIGADKAWAQNLTGAGLKVGVIDTGIDYTHPDIAPIYKGGYDSFYQDEDPYEEVPLTKEEDPFNVGYKGTYHGTHVAGTIIGQFANQDSDIVQKGVAYDAELYAYKVLGRNLERPDRSSGSSAQVIDGIERAVKDGMDVINLSLGSDSEKNPNSPDAIAINNAVLSGVVAVIANGNAGPGHYTMGSPASSQLAISVGAITSEETRYSGQLTASFIEEIINEEAASPTDLLVEEEIAVETDSAEESLPAVEAVAPPVVQEETTEQVEAPLANEPQVVNFNLLGWETTQTDFAAVLGTEAQDVVYAGLGDRNDYNNIDANGKIVLVSRGKLAFVDKIANAKANGAKAIVVFNGRAAANGIDADLTPSIPGLDGAINVNVGDSFDYIPAFDIEGAVGRTLARQLVETPEKALTISFPAHYESNIVPGDQLADFTSWGPNSDDLLSIKPDLTAPGVNILSTYPKYGKYKKDASYAKAYARLNGTSMATPHVAGLALLLKQQHPDWTPFDIRAALTNTADVLTDDSGNAFDVYKQGAGRANVGNAIETPALLQAVEPITILDKNYNRQKVTNYNSSASFGVVSLNSEHTKKLQLKNTSDQSVSYTASVQWYGQDGGIHASLTQEQVTASAKASTEFELKIATQNEAAEGLYQGQVKLESPGHPTLHLPFSLFIGEEKPATGYGVQELTLTNELIYPKRTSQNKADLSFKLTAEDANYYIIEIINLEDDTIGFLEEKSTDHPDEFLKTGVYGFKGVTDAYHPYDEDGAPILDDNGKPVTAYLKDGQYRINVVAAQLDEDGALVYQGTNPILYNGFVAFRIDHAAGPNPGGDPGTPPGNGGGSGNSGGGYSGGSPISTPATGVKQEITAVEKAIIPQGYNHNLIPVTAKADKDKVIGGITDAQLTKALKDNENKDGAFILQLPYSSSTKVNSAVKISLTAEQLKAITASKVKQPLLVFSTGKEAVAIPSTLLTKAPENAGIEVTVGLSEDDNFKNAIPSTRSLIGTPVTFQAAWTTADLSKSIQVPTNTFIKRGWAVSDEVKANQAGVLYQAQGHTLAIASYVAPQADKTTIVTVSHPGFSTYVLAKQSIDFKDISSSWAESHIKALAHKFIVEGTNADTFSPTSSLTRAQFTALLVRSLGLTASTEASKTPFSDISSAAWYANDVATAYEVGLVQGTTATTFSPDSPVSRQDLAVLLTRALTLTGAELDNSKPLFSNYADTSSISAYAKESVQVLSTYGIIHGESAEDNINFNPQKPATRETAVAALHQLLRGVKFVE